jgi:hypothetical protein
MTWQLARHKRLASFVALVVLVLSHATTQAQAPNTKKYPFVSPPLELYDQFAKAGLGSVEPFSADDRKLLSDFWTARVSTPPKELPPADDAAVTLHLLASGVTGARARAEYLKKFTDLVASAQLATANTLSPREKADLLLRHLHRTVMAKGYETKQTTVASIFDTGKFNCVSASELYFLVGTRLGLKLQPVLIPGSGGGDGHAAIDLIDGGRRIEIEPTNPEGYDWPTKLKKPGVVVNGPQPDRKRAYDGDGFALAASAASNMGALANTANPPRPMEAVHWEVIALVLAPTDPGVENNMLASVSNWGIKLAEGKKYEDSVKVFAFAVAALGTRKELEQNVSALFDQWADGAMKSKDWGEAVRIYDVGLKQFPKNTHLQQNRAYCAQQKK